MDLKYSYISRSMPQVGIPSLLDREIQLEFYKEIKGIRNGNVDNLLARYRKLREGIVASRAEPDDFILNVYLDSIDLALIANNFSELVKSLEGVLDVIQVMNCTRIQEIQEYFLLYLITYGSNTMEFYKFYKKFTADSTNHDFSLRILKDLNDPMELYDFFRIYKTASVNQRVFLDLKIENVRKRYIKVLSKGFKELEAKYLQELMGFFKMDDLVSFLNLFFPGFSMKSLMIDFRPRAK